MTIPHVVVPHRGLTGLAHSSLKNEEERKNVATVQKRATKRMRAGLWAGLAIDVHLPKGENTKRTTALVQNKV